VTPARAARRILGAVALTTVALVALGFATRQPAHPAPQRAAATGAAQIPPATWRALAIEPAPGREAVGPCVRNRRLKLVVVSIRRQEAWACHRHRTVINTPVTTGAVRRPGDATPRGSFAVQGLDRNTRLTTSADGSYEVKYWIPFHLGVWGFHDASWQRLPFGSPRYRSRGSHGCVHVPLPAMRHLFHWVDYGTIVRIR
jgi:hypothetical protein